MTKQEKLNKFNQLRNKIGGTVYPVEGLRPVVMENDRMTSVARRLAAATQNDNTESRIRESIQRRKDFIKKGKLEGRISKDDLFEIWAFDDKGNPEKEII